MFSYFIYIRYKDVKFLYNTEAIYAQRAQNDEVAAAIALQLPLYMGDDT